MNRARFQKIRYDRHRQIVRNWFDDRVYNRYVISYEFAVVDNIYHIYVID